MAPFDLQAILDSYGPESGSAYARHLNPRFHDLLRLVGFERRFVRHIGLAEESFGDDVGGEPAVSGLAIEDIAESFEPAHRGLWIRFEEELMRHRNVVRFVFNPKVQRRLIYPFRGVFSRLRGGSYTWYVD